MPQSPTPIPDRQTFEQRLRYWLEPSRRRRVKLPDFAPELNYGRHRGPAYAAVRRAAVVALFYPHAGQWHLPLTLRAGHLNDHAGQVSFPGGAAEGEESDRQCALRELREELGVNASGLRILGDLSPTLVYSSGFLVNPTVALTNQRPVFQPDPSEVDRLLEVPARHLLDVANYGWLSRQHGAIAFRAPAIAFDDLHIWGATSLMLAELIGVLRQAMAACDDRHQPP